MSNEYEYTACDEYDYDFADYPTEDEYESMPEYQKEELIDEREIEIEDSVYSMLDTFLGDFDEVSALDWSDMCSDLSECICRYLHDKYGLSVYRPMYLKNKDGEEEFVLYPYETV